LHWAGEVAATLMVSAAGRTTVDRQGTKSRSRVALIGSPFLLLCDFLMHRALYFGKVLYEQKVTRDNRAAFLRMCKDAHNTPDARQELQECWKNHLAFRATNKMQIAYGLPAGTALYTADGRALPVPDADDLIQRMHMGPAAPVAAAEAAPPADGGGGRPQAASADAAVGNAGPLPTAAPK
jgi:hypothetical protein